MALPVTAIQPACHAVHPGIPCTRTAPGGYCVPPRCYCGACPWHLPIDRMPTYTPDRYTAFDRAAVLSSTGRRANLAQYRAAQASRP